MLGLESWASCSILTGGNILFCFYFCFHVVKPLMPILALLPMLCVCENPDCNLLYYQTIGNNVDFGEEIYKHDNGEFYPHIHILKLGRSVVEGRMFRTSIHFCGCVHEFHLHWCPNTWGFYKWLMTEYEWTSNPYFPGRVIETSLHSGCVCATWNDFGLTWAFSPLPC